MKKLLLLVLITALPAAVLHADEHAGSYAEMASQYLQKASTGKSPFTQEDMAIMQKSAEDLHKNLPDPGIKVGEQAPDFTLPNAFGKNINLGDNLKQGPVVLVFYRGAWCPFCNMHLHALQNNLDEFKKYGAQLITVTPQTPDKSAEQIRKDGYPFEVLSDLDNHVMRAYKLCYKLDDDLVKVYKKVGLDIEAYNGAGRNELPVPGAFVIDRQGVVRAMFADTDYQKRMEPADIIEVLKKL